MNEPRRPPPDRPAEERGSLASRLTPIDPPPELEQRVLASLAERKLIGTPVASGGVLSRRNFQLAAAAVLLFAAGVTLDRTLLAPRTGTQPTIASGGEPEHTHGNRYLLLLYQDAKRARTPNPKETGSVAEYRDWAIGIARRGNFIEGERLGDAGWSIRDSVETPASRAAELTSTTWAVADPAPQQAPEVLQGFFIVGASSLQEAMALARSCPHLRYGGRIVVRNVS